MVQGAILVSTGKRHGTTHRGGGRNYKKMKSGLERLLKQHRGEDVRFTTMLDLYGLYRDFPGTTEANAARHTLQQRVSRLEQAFAADIGDDRLIPYVQVHEFEAILLCEPEVLSRFYPDASRKIARLTAEIAEFESPERINDGPQTAPSKRIGAYFEDFESAKTTIAAEIAPHIALATVRAKCPHFDAWLSLLETLAGPDHST